MACPFCNLGKRGVMYTGKEVFVLMSNPRLVKGHLLIVPKRHVEKLSELNASERTEMLDTVIVFQEKLMKIFEGCDIRQHCRPFLPEGRTKVDHVHFHVLPRNNKDELYQVVQIHQNKLWKDLSDGEIQEVQELLKQNI